MIRAYTATCNRPRPQQRFKSLDHAEDGGALKGGDRLLDLGHGWDKAQIDSSRSQDTRGMGNHLPRLRKIQHEPIKWHAILEKVDSFISILAKCDEVRHRTHIPFYVAPGGPRKIFTGLIRDDDASRAYCS
jgi:hypothetical protein